jgi:myo-inositol-1(or 4)-monophosphatase
MVINFEELATKTIETAKNAGAMIRAEKSSFSKKNVIAKGLHDFVSYVDKQSEKYIVGALSQILPEAGFIAEEGTGLENSDGLNWIIDPLDGTTNFIHGVPVFSVSIALIQNGEIVIGVVYEINLDECFYAWKGSKAFLNGKPISVSNNPALKDSLLATGFPYYDYSRLEPYLGFFRHVIKNTLGVRRLGSAAVDLAYTACGRFEGFYEYGLNSWDVAAGAFIVKQAGGRITDFSGGKNYIFGRELIASNTLIHLEMLTTIQQFFKQQ